MKLVHRGRAIWNRPSLIDSGKTVWVCANVNSGQIEAIRNTKSDALAWLKVKHESEAVEVS